MQIALKAAELGRRRSGRRRRWSKEAPAPKKERGSGAPHTTPVKRQSRMTGWKKGSSKKGKQDPRGQSQARSERFPQPSPGMKRVLPPGCKSREGALVSQQVRVKPSGGAA